MNDAERLMQAFVHLLAQSPFRIAPERVDELVKEMEGEPWPLDINAERANFTAYPSEKKITGTYAAMLSLWAVAAAVLAMMNLTRAAVAAGKSTIVIEPGGPGSEVVEFKHAAVALIRNSAASWSEALPDPDHAAPLSTPDGLVTNLFLAAASVVVLHECGHIVLKHLPDSPQAHQQEFEADAWAVEWILGKVMDAKEREFRTLAICIAFIWIGLIDDVRRAGTTHPHAAQRLGQAFERFSGLTDESEALEIGSYMLKAFFDPTTDLPQADCAREGFVDRLIDYVRSQ
ncbi:phage exclusion protein Lit family protein [Sinorhizobium meliloti]|uniref:phage exclusion protein Lit family protein n=1 Tax=Rhizobium meliloti TaxID=382 RepID=UPI001295D815|nr:phage exclusion protein Lit family protein [Sinorhizobium meliloti]MDW9378035.1 hypothetical protein [Sinorhizobium meliloti]MDW9496636.1 hypothetical protein [Sinorhizobium meliloti]MDW9565188.1 hypothetical protein [Sinorhizobium meliloti]MDW9652614.1 hypothetical protein [Sinorhizobium meliloti]MDW9862804.1 hypothetical protein [Sinorhizobium meliloti]